MLARFSSNQIAESFTIKATRLKSALSDDKTFYWFYVSLHLEQNARADVSLDQIAMVEYHLLHDSFPKKNIRITDPRNGFEYRFWLYGFIEVSAEVVLKIGDIVRLPATKLSWAVEVNEVNLNGKKELSWE